MNISHSESIVGRPARPGETPTRKGIPVVRRPGSTPAQGSRPKPKG